MVIALQNLIENALGHAPPGMTVKKKNAAPAPLRVMDRGRGMAH